MTPVKDPELLRQLNGASDDPAPAGLKRVTDPLILKSLENKKPSMQEQYGEFKERDTRGRALGANALLQGMTFGFGDEIVGAAGALAGLPLKLVPDALASRLSPEDQAARSRSFGENYVAARDKSRGMLAEFQAESPGLNIATQAVGGLMLPVPGGKAIEAATQGIKSPVGRTVANLAAQGAVAGGIGGAGAASSAAEIPGAIARGAAFGAAAAPVVAAGAGGVGGVVNNVRGRFSEGAAGDLARRRFATAMLQDETTPLRVGARLEKLGDRAVIADGGGQNVRNLADLMATLPGQTANRAEQLIHKRQAGRGPALIGSAEQAMETGGQRMAPTVQEWIALRESDAQPWYDKAHAIQIRPDSELRAIVSAADELGAISEARKIATAKRKPLSLDSAASEWSMLDLDRVKQGLDVQIGNSFTKRGEATPVTRALMGLKTDLVKRLDAATDGVYAEARKVWAGPTAMTEAAEKGRKVMSMDDASIRQVTAELEGSELQAFQLGAFEALRAKLGTEAGQTSILKMWKEPATREKLQAMFPTERAFREFASTVAAEARLKGLEGIGRGAQTARRTMGADEFNAANAADAVDVATGVGANPFRTFARVSEIYGKASTPEPVRNAIGRLLLTEKQLAAPELQSLEQIMQDVAAQRSRQAAASANSGAAGLRALLGL